MKSKVDKYQAVGYVNRTDYLCDLAQQLSIPFSTVARIAARLGRSADFDGLREFLEDRQIRAAVDKEEY